MGLGYGPLTSGMNILGAGLLILHIFALVDACLRPAAAFPAADKQTKGLWTILLGVAVVWGALPSIFVGTFVFRGLDLIVIAGTVVALVYLVDARPAVRNYGGGRGGRFKRSQGPRGGW